MPALLALAVAPVPCRRAMQLRGVQAAETSDSEPPASDAQSCADPGENGGRPSPAAALLPDMSPGARQSPEYGFTPVLGTEAAFSSAQDKRTDRCGFGRSVHAESGLVAHLTLECKTCRADLRVAC